MNARVASAVGDYHSRIVLRCYLQSQSTAECMRSISDLTYKELSYYDSFDSSFFEMTRREQQCDIQMADFIEGNIKSTNLFYTVNHPTNLLLSEMARKISNHFSVTYNVVDFQNIPSNLSTDPQWPIVPEIIERFCLSYSNGNLFYCYNSVLDWDEYVARTYSLYDYFGIEKLLACGSPEQLSDLQFSSK